MVRRIGKMVEFSMWSDLSIPANQELGTLAGSYRPVTTTYPNLIYLRNSLDTPSNIIMSIGNDGKIKNLGNANVSGRWVVLHGVWSTSLPT